MAERTITTYKCQNPKCGATDKDNGFNLPAPTELNCYSCKAKGAMLKESEERVS